MAVSAQAALDSVRLIVQINDWSLRALGPHELKTGFGFLQAKPSTSFAPVAVTPDELGDAWRDGRVHMSLPVQWNGERFGEPNGGEMNFHFGRLIAHAARTRRVSAGTIIGSLLEVPLLGSYFLKKREHNKVDICMSSDRNSVSLACVVGRSEPSLLLDLERNPVGRIKP